MKKIFRYLKIQYIDIFIYRMPLAIAKEIPDIGFSINKEIVSNSKNKYTIIDKGKLIHSSFTFSTLHILKLINKKGPAIGDCTTIPEYRGKSIYPFVINRIAIELLTDIKYPEVFIIVNNNNVSSIRGIEKAGFQLYSKITTKRFLLFYFDTKIVKYN